MSEDQEGEPEWRGLIVALPDPVDHEPATEPEIAAALGVIKSSGAAIANHCRGMAFLRELRDKLPSDPPFAQLPEKAVGMVCDNILQDLEHASLKSDDLEAEIRRTEGRLHKTVAQFWSPLVLAEIPVPAKHRENWTLLMNWQRWIAETGELEELTKKFFAHRPGLSSAAVGKPQITAFRKRLEYLDLPASAASIRDARMALDTRI